jgi:phytanoyl-CoA hydroxylase
VAQHTGCNWGRSIAAICGPQDRSNEDDLVEWWPDLRYEPRVTPPLRVGGCTFHNSFTPHMAHANNTDIARVAHIVIYMDAETTYTGARRVVTDPLGLPSGEVLIGEMFPRLPPVH